jgi:hypothetical protein
MGEVKPTTPTREFQRRTYQAHLDTYRRIRQEGGGDPSAIALDYLLDEVGADHRDGSLADQGAWALKFAIGLQRGLFVQADDGVIELADQRPSDAPGKIHDWSSRDA